ncbi:MAG: insulinase family protein [Planctomycetota bacterium]
MERSRFAFIALAVFALSLAGCAGTAARMPDDTASALTSPGTISAAADAAAITKAKGTALPRDPDNVTGSFANGFQYIVRHHTNPPGRVELQLHIKTGALNETATQNGLAHFLEHMCFNGSTHFAPGELIPYMNQLGMQFGADSNAHTTYHETVYKLSMPDNKPETIDKALTIFSDFANGLLLLDAEIDKERDIISNEKGTRKGAMQRMQEKGQELLFAGTRFATHNIIGTDDVIMKSPRAEFVDYWNTWYRPELMTLIVVGEVDSQQLIEKAKTSFAALTARAPARPQQGTGIKPFTAERAFVITDPEQVTGMVQVIAAHAGAAPASTVEELRAEELRAIGPWVVNRRLQDRVQRGEAAFFGGGLGVVPLFSDALLATGAVAGEASKWNEMLAQLVEETLRAVEHGVTSAELELAKKEILAAAERDVVTAPTLNANALIGRFAGQVGLGEPIISAAQRLELVKQILPAISVEDVNRRFAADYRSQPFTYVLLMPEQVEPKLPTSDDVLTAARAAWARRSAEVVEQQVATSLLEALPNPGTVRATSKDADLNVTRLELSNGAIVHHRFMDYKKDLVTVTITLPGGVIEETTANRGVSEVASLIGATSRLSSSQIRDLMTGKTVSVSANIGLDACTVQVSGPPAEMEDGLKLAYAMMTDGIIEPSALDNWKKSTKQAMEMAKTQAPAVVIEAMGRTFFGGDPRFARLTEAQIEQQTTGAGEAWARRFLGRAPMEVAIVGDMPLEQIEPLVCRYIGSLPPAREGFDALSSVRKLGRGPGPYAETATFESITPQAAVAAGFVGGDSTDVATRRKLSMVAEILSVRMIKRLREDLQLVYGIRCIHQPAEAIPGTGQFFAFAQADAENGEKLAVEIHAMMREFATNGPTEEEMEVARKQIANTLDKQLLEPRYWLAQLDDLEYRGRKLDEFKGIVEYYNQITAAQLRETASRMFVADKEIRLLAVPKAPAVN